MARRDPVGIRLITRRGNDWTTRFPLIVEAVNHLKVRSCLIDGEAVCCNEGGLAVFAKLRRQREGERVFRRRPRVIVVEMLIEPDAGDRPWPGRCKRRFPDEAAMQAFAKSWHRET